MSSWEKVEHKKKKKHNVRLREPEVEYHHDAAAIPQPIENAQWSHTSPFATIDDDLDIDELSMPARVAETRHKPNPTSHHEEAPSTSTLPAKPAKRKQKKTKPHSSPPRVRYTDKVLPEDMASFFESTRIKYSIDQRVQLQVVADYVETHIEGMASGIAPHVPTSQSEFEAYWAWPLSGMDNILRKRLEEWLSMQPNVNRAALLVPLIRHINSIKRKDTTAIGKGDGARCILQLLCKIDDAPLLDRSDGLAEAFPPSDAVVPLLCWVVGQVSGLKLWSVVLGAALLYTPGPHQMLVLNAYKALLSRTGGPWMTPECTDTMLKLRRGIAPHIERKGASVSKEQRHAQATVLAAVIESLCSSDVDYAVRVLSDAAQCLPLLLPHCRDDAFCTSLCVSCIVKHSDLIEIWLTATRAGVVVGPEFIDALNEAWKLDRDTAKTVVGLLDTLCDECDDGEADAMERLHDHVQRVASAWSWWRWGSVGIAMGMVAIGVRYIFT